MNDKQVLVIDDSATIRKLVESHLGTAGYDVSAAPNAEDGIRMAQEIRPDLILLDHQLPGTTGLAVCQQLITIEELKQTPVVISSTLRKKAYVEYADLDNVVDMLPKPYTEDLLITTVANAIETAEMVLASQSVGAAVPEIIGDSTDAELQGTFSIFDLREIMDMLNNSQKRGSLELAGEKLRLWIYLDKGRVQGISASGITNEEIDEMISRLPESLTNLSEVLRLTVASRGSAEFESFLQLLDRRVIDPRLTTRLLRFQAAQLMGMAIERNLTSFEFRACSELPGIHRSLPLDLSVMALLVENSMHLPESRLPQETQNEVFARRSLRGQNLDRAGLSARHMKVLSLVSEPISSQDLASRLGWEPDEARRVLHGLVSAGILERRQESTTSKFVVFETDTTVAGQLRAAMQKASGEYLGKVVRDPLTLQLLVKRAKPDAVFFSLQNLEACEEIRDSVQSDPKVYASTRRVIIAPDSLASDPTIAWAQLLGFQPDQILGSPYNVDSLLESLSQDSSQVVESQPVSTVTRSDQDSSPIVVSVELKPTVSEEITQ